MTPKEQEAFDKGRLQGLKEMDFAICGSIQENGVLAEKMAGELDFIGSLHCDHGYIHQKLRKEYSGK